MKYNENFKKVDITGKANFYSFCKMKWNQFSVKWNMIYMEFFFGGKQISS